MGKGAEKRKLAPPTALAGLAPPQPHHRLSSSAPRPSTSSSSSSSTSSLPPPPAAAPRSLPSFGSVCSRSTTSAATAACDALPNAVFLNVYDVLTPDDPATIPRLNNVLVHCGMGIFHTGVQVWRREFAFGGHPDEESGIFEVEPRNCPAVRYRTSLLLGYTRVSEQHLEHLLSFLGDTDYIGSRYSLISRNCNTFSHHLTGLLGVQDKFPAWVNRLAGIAVNVRCLLPEGIDEPLAEHPAEQTPAIKEPQKPPPVALL